VKIIRTTSLFVAIGMVIVLLFSGLSWAYSDIDNFMGFRWGQKSQECEFLGQLCETDGNLEGYSTKISRPIWNQIEFRSLFLVFNQNMFEGVVGIGYPGEIIWEKWVLFLDEKLGVPDIVSPDGSERKWIGAYTTIFIIKQPDGNQLIISSDLAHLPSNR